MRGHFTRAIVFIAALGVLSMGACVLRSKGHGHSHHPSTQKHKKHNKGKGHGKKKGHDKHKKHKKHKKH